ncbi:MAG: tetratricopeptide repeat protein [Nitrospira sp. CG24E]|nr:MAG: tetratricopeptide repeat protein [Nitrospira sp. CG24E]
MEASPRHSPHQIAARWWEFPSWEHIWLIVLTYRRVLFGLVVAVAFLFIQDRLSTMDSRLLRPSTDGVRGLIHYEIGHYNNAALAYRADLRTGGWRKWANGDDAYTALLKGNLSEAARLTDLQLTEQPANIEAWLTQGEVALEEGNLRRASAAFDQAVALDDKHFDALLLSAVAHSRLGDDNQAIDRFRHALRNDYVGQRITAFLWALQAAGDLRQGSPDGLGWCLLAHYYRYLRIFDPSNAPWAKDAAIKAIDLGGRIDDAYITLGILEEKTGDYDAALPYFLKAVAANPRNPEAYRRAASMYSHRGSDLLNEYMMWKGAYTASPSDGFYRDTFVAFLSQRLGDYPQALDLVHQGLNEEPQNTDLLGRVANLYQRLGHHDDAIRFYRDILALQPRNPSVLDAIGYSLIYLERYDDAVASYQNALAINANRSASHRGLGSAYARQRRYTDSIREYETALQLGDDDIDIRAYLCNQYWAVNRYRDADTCLKHVLRRDPHNKTALYIYPYVLMSLEQGERER